MCLDIGTHVDDAVLEKYLLARLPDREIAAVEEHLLACPECQCQAEEIEDFVLATKAALPAVMRKPPAWDFHVAAAMMKSWSGVTAFAAVAALVAVAVIVPLRPSRSGSEPAEVRLSAMRGPDTVLIHAQAGRGLILDLDAVGLPAGSEYAVRVVDSGGAEVWTGTPQTLQRAVHVVLSRTLSPGRYWVRLMRGPELVREYGLKID